jgi:hypothetical protein
LKKRMMPQTVVILVLAAIVAMFAIIALVAPH